MISSVSESVAKLCGAQANKAQLSATVTTQIEAARCGMALLDKAHQTLANMQGFYRVCCHCCCCCCCARQPVLSCHALQTIDQLCTECSALIENHEKIQLLSAVHYNLGKTLQVELLQADGTSEHICFHILGLILALAACLL